MTSMIGIQEEEKVEEEDKTMEEERKGGRSCLFNAPHNGRHTVGLTKSSLKNNKLMEEFKGLPN